MFKKIKRHSVGFIVPLRCPVCFFRSAFFFGNAAGVFIKVLFLQIQYEWYYGCIG